METLYCVNVSIVAYEGQEGTGHVIMTVTEPSEPRTADTIDITVPGLPAGGDVRLWARRVLGLAAAEL